MKKFMSTVMATIGIMAVALTIYFVINFGATNMRRVDEQSVRWRMDWSSRR